MSGIEAQQTADRILNGFQLSDTDLSGICQAVYEALAGRPIFGSKRIDALEIEDILTDVIAGRLKDAMSLDEGVLSLAFKGSSRVGDELGRLMVDMRRAPQREEKLWREGDYRMGHVDSARVGITLLPSRYGPWGSGRSRRFLRWKDTQRHAPIKSRCQRLGPPCQT